MAEVCKLDGFWGIIVLFVTFDVVVDVAVVAVVVAVVIWSAFGFEFWSGFGDDTAFSAMDFALSKGLDFWVFLFSVLNSEFWKD